MTVAAVILSATTDGAIADTLGQPRVRRLADLAWSGGALPVVVVTADPEGTVAKALLGSEAVLGSPAPPEAGPAGQMVRGAGFAMAEVRDTTAVLIWPARMTWIGPETITTLIEAHGLDPVSMLRPAWHGETGWPVLLPTEHLGALRGVAATRMPPDVIEDLAASIPSRVVEVGDPGVTHDVDTARDALPQYEGPPDPPGGHSHEWGADVATEAGLSDS
jgi:CTP:molybdopterin cytidylyltransferase MocA